MDLAHILKHRFEVSDEALSESLHIQSEKGGRLGEILMERQAITEIQMLEALGMRYEIPFWPELPMENIGSDFSKKVSIQFLKRHFIVPMTVPSPTGQAQAAADGNGQTSEVVNIIAVNDPSDFSAVDDLANILGLDNFKLVLSTKQAILACIQPALTISCIR